MSLSLVVTPSNRLTQLLLKHKLPNPVYILEHDPQGPHGSEENEENIVIIQGLLPSVLTHPHVSGGGSVKKTLNSISALRPLRRALGLPDGGVYVCINLVNGKMYVGSAYLNSMYRRYRGHLYLAKGGSKIVNNSVLKYGLINFAFRPCGQ